MDSFEYNSGRTLKGRTFKNLFLFGVGTISSRFLGFLRELFLAYTIGASHYSDVFYASFRIVNFFRIALGESLIQSSLVPVVVSLKKEKKDITQFLKSTYTLFFFVSLLLTLLGIVFAPFLISIFAPGFKKILFKYEIGYKTLRIMFLFLFFIVLSAFLSGILNSEKKFFIPSFSPFFFNFLFLITGLAGFFVFNIKDHKFLYILALGITLGGLFQFLFQVPFVFKNYFNFCFTKNLFIPEMKALFLLFIPMFLSIFTGQIIMIVTTFLASFLPEGQLSYLSYAYRLRHFPIAMIGIGIATVSLPYMTEESHKLKYLKNIYKLAFSLLFPISLLLILHSDFIVRILFERGAFDRIDTLNTSMAFIMFCIGIIPSALLSIHLNYFYSRKKILEANISFLYTLSSFLFFSVFLLKFMGFSGLALASSLSTITGFIALLFYTPSFLEFKEFKSFILTSFLLILFLFPKFFSIEILDFGWDLFLSLIFIFYWKRKWKLQRI